MVPTESLKIRFCGFLEQRGGVFIGKVEPLGSFYRISCLDLVRTCVQGLNTLNLALGPSFGWKGIAPWSNERPDFALNAKSFCQTSSRGPRESVCRSYAGRLAPSDLHHLQNLHIWPLLRFLAISSPSKTCKAIFKALKWCLNIVDMKHVQKCSGCWLVWPYDRDVRLITTECA